jgi:hypothetical protein
VNVAHFVVWCCWLVFLLLCFIFLGCKCLLLHSLLYNVSCIIFSLVCLQRSLCVQDGHSVLLHESF